MQQTCAVQGVFELVDVQENWERRGERGRKVRKWQVPRLKSARRVGAGILQV